MTGNAGRIAVLHFDNARIRGGVEEHMLTLLRGLDRTRFKLMMAVHPDLLELIGPDLPSDVEAIPLQLEGPRDFSGALRFISILRDRRVDIVHSHMFQASRLGSPLALLAGVPVRIETPHVRESWRSGWIKGSYLIDRSIGRFVTTYIAVSEANYSYLVNDKQLPATKVVLVRNGISLEQFDPERMPRPGMRCSLGISEDAPVVAVIARLEPQKGHRVLMDAWQSVIQAFPKAVLVCVGAGQLRDELETYTANSGLSHSVRFPGYQSKVADWLTLADFTVLPSFFEGLPLAAIESLATARAVIGTAVDGTTEVVRDGETGLLVPPGEPGPLATAICRLLAMPELARNLGSTGSRWVRQHFNARHQVMNTETVYEDALRLVENLSERRKGERK
ncbi:MAG: glycosyltransferase family 4 protein [Deltaproteobacteria bacterium]|nr:glycosyltransferase family 4 protein [Deltaproteobacteria bacterium]